MDKEKMKNSLANFASIRILVVIMIGSGILVYSVIAGFIHALVLAFIFAVIFRPLHFWIKKRINSPGLASLITFIIILIFIIGPVLVIGSVLSYQSQQIIELVTKWFKSEDVNIEIIISELNKFFETSGIGAEITVDQVQAGLHTVWTTLILGGIQAIANLVGSFFKNAASYIIFMFALFTLLEKMEDVVNYVKELSPFSKSINNKFGIRVSEMSVSMIKGTFIIAFVKGLLSGLILLLVGFPFVPVWTLIATFLSIVPIGSGLVMFPIAVIMIIAGDPISGIIVFIYTIMITENAELVLRPKLVGESAKLPDIIILIAVLGGITAFGFMGIVYGPLVVIVFLTALEVYKEYSHGKILLTEDK